MKLHILLQGNFCFGGFIPEPPLGACLPPDPPAGGIGPPDPAEGVPTLCTPPCRRVYILLGCKYFMGYKHGWKQGPLNQEDNQAPQPTFSISQWKNFLSFHLWPGFQLGVLHLKHRSLTLSCLMFGGRVLLWWGMYLELESSSERRVVFWYTSSLFSAILAF